MMPVGRKFQEEMAAQFDADKAAYIADAMLDAEKVCDVLNDMVFDQAAAQMQTDALAFAIVYGRNDDRTIDAFNRLEAALKKRLESA